MESLTDIVIQYWPVGMCIVCTFPVVHSFKRTFKTENAIVVRLIAFVVGFGMTYVAMKFLSAGDSLYSAIFVGVFNPSFYALIMLYFKIKIPVMYKSLQKHLRISQG